MAEFDMIKGINALKVLAKNIRSVIEYCENNHIGDLLPYIEEMNSCCSILTDIFEKSFFDMVERNERIEDDGK